MNKFLATTALVAAMSFGGAAMAAPVLNAQGVPLLSWTDQNGNAKIGTQAEYDAAVAALSPVGPRPDTAGPAQTAWEVAQAAATSFVQKSAAVALDDSAPVPTQSVSLLSGILADADSLSASLTNISQNLNNVDGSINVGTDRDMADFSEIIDSLTGGGDSNFGSYSQVNANVYGRDIPAALLNVLNPLTLELGNLSTTAIGSLQSGNMTATFDASGLLAKATSSSTAATTSASMLGEQYGAIALPIAMQNVSVNTGAIDGSVNLALNDVNTKTGTIGTTAIGSLGSGAMTATITGAMGSAGDTGKDIVNALVGGTN